MKTQSICCCILLYLSSLLPAAVPRDFAVDLKAAVSDSEPHIILSWTLRVPSNITAQKIHRRLKGQTTWTKLADLSTSQLSYADATATTGVEYEYWMERTLSGLNPTTAVGYLSAGVKVPEVHSRGVMLLLIDNTMETPLAPEIAQLKLDLAAEGWTVRTITAPRTGTAISTKALITAAYNADPTNVKAVYLLGHVPVPYSGNQAPDGHVPDHVGAWPADGYYGDIDGNWTDTSVNNTAATGTRNDNIPGDGKFDQVSLPGLVELQVGRVDLHTMTKAPTSGVTEVTRLRRYLQRAHAFRHKLGAYANIPRRSLIRDGFGHAFSSEPFAVNGWATAFSSVGTDITEAPSGQWFSATYAGGKDYLWGHGCGAGSYESASTFGTTTDVGRLPSRVVFTSLFGSYHGDWDADNNIMRAMIAGNAAGDSLGLVCFWSGRPHWFLHTLGMGETMGHAARLSMNSLVAGGGSYLPSSSSARGVHLGLMGDPALRMHTVEPPRNLAATTAAGVVDLAWSASTDTAVQGYHVYRSESASGPFTRLTTAPLTDTTYTDIDATADTAYIYLVRTLKLETVPGGSYYNLSTGSPAGITVSSAASPAPRNPTELAATWQTGGVSLTWQDNSTDETGFRIERKTNVAGTFTTLATVAAGTTSHLDPGPFTNGNVYFYRVTATGAGGNSIFSNEVSFQGTAGFVEFNLPRMKLIKTSGTVEIKVARSGGVTGAVAVNYATANFTAMAGTHYTSRSGTLNWADGEQGEKTISVPITNTSVPQLARQFRVSLSSATNGLSINTQNQIAIQIEDPSATLPSPWLSTMIGSVTDSSPAVIAEGVLGDSLMGGSGAIAAATTEAGRYIYQTRNGDGVMTVYVPTPSMAQVGARFAVMVRASVANNSIMASTVTASAAANFGTRFVHRAAASGAAVSVPTADNHLDTPQWVRITRVGNLFTSECSADGITWITLGSTTLASMPTSAVWGIFHYSSAPNSTTQIGDYHLATYQNISLPASPPAALTATPGTTAISLAWTDVATTETGYELERQVANGDWSPLRMLAAGATSTSDATVLPGVTYHYRLRALGVTGNSDWVEATAIAPGTAPGYRRWLLANSLPMDESGDGAATVSPTDDGVVNLVKYALGLPADAKGHEGRVSTSITPSTLAEHLTFTYLLPHPAPEDITYSVEASGDLSATGWSTEGIIPVTDTTSGNLRTVTVRLAAAVDDASPRFMRLKIIRP